jgi:dehydrogenase/reductase SDR family protein 7B
MATQRFRERVVWITGASSGIGEALALAFAREGARLVLSARRADELERVAAKCHGAPTVDVVTLDLADLEALPAAVETVLARVGPVDVMVHNGGVSQRSLIAETRLSVDERIMRVNHFGAVALTKSLLPSMVSRRRGRFVVVSSVMGVYSSPMRSAYAASKHALHGFFDALRAEHARDGIGVTMVCPGFVRTNVSTNALTGDGSPRGARADLNAKGMSAEYCAAVVLDAVHRERREVYLGGREKLGVYLKRYAPAVLAFLLPRVKVT